MSFFIWINVCLFIVARKDPQTAVDLRTHKIMEKADAQNIFVVVFVLFFRPVIQANFTFFRTIKDRIKEEKSRGTNKNR